MRRLLLLLAILAAAPGCLVLGLHPAYDDESIGWEPALLGTWADVEDNASLVIERSEWKSYRIQYAHPIERGELTGYLTSIGDDRYLDVMPMRGEDRGAVVIPVHAMVRVQLAGDRLELTPLSYDWIFDRLRARTAIPGLAVTLDQKENALITSPSARLRAWIRSQPRDGLMFGAAAVFVRKSAGRD